MARKKKPLSEEELKQQKLQKLQKYYDKWNIHLSLSNYDVVEQIHVLIDKANELQSEICSVSDDIKIADLEKVKELTPIDKKTYLDFVNICVLKSNDKLHEKAIDKFEKDFAHRLFITNLRHSFLESYINSNELKITDEDNSEYTAFTDYKSDEFLKIMESSAKKREYLITLHKTYKELAKAAEFITDLELDYKTFKNLSDWKYYAEGCYPSPKSPSKIWAIFQQFNDAHRALSKWGYQNTIDDLTHEFGLSVSEQTPHPVQHPWIVNDDDEIIDA